MKKIYKNLIILLALFPSFSFAALDGLRGLMNSSLDLINLGIRILFALAMAFFFWGLAQFILKSGDVKLREEGKNRMVWGILALFVMASIYGILAFVGNLVGINPNSSGANITPSSVNSGSGGNINSNCDPTGEFDQNCVY